jgi:ATP-binding cassette subfamily B multidrug efflux pump
MPDKSDTVSTSKAALFLLSYIRRHSASIAIGIGMLVAVDLFQLLIPRVVQRTLDMLGEEHFAREAIAGNTVKIILLALAMIVTRFFWRLCIIGPSRRIEAEMREEMFAHLEGLSFSFFNRAKTGDLLALLVNDLSAVRMAAGMALIGLIDTVFMGSMSLIFMLTINVRLTLITIIPLPLIILVMVRFGGLIQNRFKEVQESFSEISTRTQEAFSGIRVIKGFGQEKAEVAHFVKDCDRYVKRNFRLVRLWGFFFPMISFLASIALTLLFYYGGRYVVTERISLGQFISFTFYINLLVWPMMAVGWVFNMFQRGIASAKRIIALLETRSDVRVSGETASTGRIVAGEVAIRGLSFRYAPGEREVLSDVSLTIPAASTVGLMGKPGAGKTTLASLLFHLFPVESGRIMIDGHDINAIPLDRLRSAIGYVPQDSFLFSDTIRNNIAFGLDDGAVSDEKLQSVCLKASILDEILQFPQGFETRIGERGITLSGGQKQRLAIARALCTDARILIFDDALSAVDAATERTILINLSAEIRGRTAIFIAHRISTVRSCNSIVVLDNGAIAERGTHAELLAAGGFYSRLHHLQQLTEKAV